MERAFNEDSSLRKYSTSTSIIRIRITRLAVHCYRSEEEIVKMFCCRRRTMEQQRLDDLEQLM